jgi:PKD repeat protein
VEGNTDVTGTFQGGVRKRLDVITASSDNARGYVFLSDGNSCAVIPSNEPNTSGCTIFYDPGTVITMTAQPEPGTNFFGWSGACTGTGTCTVTMDQAREVTGTFRGPSRRLTLEVGSVGGARGSVRNSVNNGLCTTTGNPVTCVITVPQVGTVVTLTALPQTGWRLLAWSGACSGTGACQVTMSDALAAGATFGPLNRPPVGNAGGPYTGVRNAPVVFDGSGSSDPDGDALTYAWDFGDGTQGTGVAPSHAYATLDTFTVTLVVSDGQASSTPATTTVTIANRPPVANAGGPYTGVRRAPVTFNGSGSSDPDGDALTYAWDFGDGTQGMGVTPSHVYATLGTFTVTLVVSDGHVSSAPSTTTVTIANAAPQANAGPDQTVRRLAVVVLDGRSSSDSDGTLAAFAWRQVSGPSVVLISPNTPRTAFVAPLVLFNPVVLEFELKVTDNDGATATDRVRVTVTR